MNDASPLYPESMHQPSRRPVTAGTFFPASAKDLTAVLDLFYNQPGGEAEKSFPGAVLVMVPHAGYVYSGAVTAKTLRQAPLPRRVILLGPCHQHRGAGLSLWPGKSWLTPLGEVPVDQDFYRLLLDRRADFAFDAAAHAHEHSLEVILPFLQARRPDVTISPIAVSRSDPEGLRLAGDALASAVQVCATADAERPLIIVSSDMSHYLSQDKTEERDSLAISSLSPRDPLALYRTVAENDITMCGVLPMTLGLFAAQNLGATEASLVCYSTSGAVSGDFNRVVGYAGVIVA